MHCIERRDYLPELEMVAWRLTLTVLKASLAHASQLGAMGITSFLASEGCWWKG